MRAIRIGIARFARRIGETCKTADVPAIDFLLLLFLLKEKRTAFLRKPSSSLFARSAVKWCYGKEYPA
jgi:hypothetical protein